MRVRRITLPVVSLVAVGAGVLALFALLDSQPGVTKSNFDRVEIGMVEEDVHELLGMEAAGPFVTRFGLHHYYIWRAKDGATANIYFKDVRVVDKSWLPSEESVLQSIKRWLHLSSDK